MVSEVRLDVLTELYLEVGWTGGLWPWPVMYLAPWITACPFATAGERRDLLRVYLMFILISVIVKLPAFPLALAAGTELPLLGALKWEEALVDEPIEGAAADWLLANFMLASLKTLVLGGLCSCTNPYETLLKSVLITPFLTLGGDITRRPAICVAF